MRGLCVVSVYYGLGRCGRAGMAPTCVGRGTLVRVCVGKVRDIRVCVAVGGEVEVGCVGGRGSARVCVEGTFVYI